MKSNIKKHNNSFKLNKVIHYLTYSDFLILSGWGLLLPFLPVFIQDEITGGTVATAGFSITIYMVTRSLLQLPIAQRLDKIKGELDDYWALILGSLLIGVCAILFAFATNITHVYIIQFINGIAYAISVPSWSAIFSRHLDRNKEALEWSFYDTVVGIGSAISAALGGIMITMFSYDTIFFIVAVISFLGILFTMGIKNSLYKK